MTSHLRLAPQLHRRAPQRRARKPRPGGPAGRSGALRLPIGSGRSSRRRIPRSWTTPGAPSCLVHTWLTKSRGDQASNPRLWLRLLDSVGATEYDSVRGAVQQAARGPHGLFVLHPLLRRVPVRPGSSMGHQCRALRPCHRAVHSRIWICEPHLARLCGGRKFGITSTGAHGPLDFR